MKRDLADWLTRLEAQHAPFDPDRLSHLRTIAKRLGCFPFPHPVITVTGTNGKGSCVSLVSAILTAQSYRVGAYTSPHVFQFIERIQIDQSSVSESALCEAFEAIECASEGFTLGYFHTVTLAAIRLFAAAPLDVVVLEVGIGGRHDAVNMLDPAVAVITSIGLDHQDKLGPDREHIAADKAGILRSGIPVIGGDPEPPTTLLEAVREQNAHYYGIGDAFTFVDQGSTWIWRSPTVTYTNLPKPQGLLQNAATALMVIDVLQGQFPVHEDAIRQGLQRAFLPGRLQVVPGDLLQIFDMAHNPQATEQLARFVKALPPGGTIYAVFSALQDKAIAACIAPLQPFVSHWFFAPLTHPRAADSSAIQAAVDALGIEQYDFFPTVGEAYHAACGQAQAGDRLLIFGSVYLVSKVFILSQFR